MRFIIGRKTWLPLPWWRLTLFLTYKQIFFNLLLIISVSEIWPIEWTKFWFIITETKGNVASGAYDAGSLVSFTFIPGVEQYDVNQFFNPILHPNHIVLVHPNFHIFNQTLIMPLSTTRNGDSLCMTTSTWTKHCLRLPHPLRMSNSLK